MRKVISDLDYRAWESHGALGPELILQTGSDGSEPCAVLSADEARKLAAAMLVWVRSHESEVGKQRLTLALALIHNI